MSKQPEALRLADLLDGDPNSKTHHDEAAAELRRLHAVNAELLQALQQSWRGYAPPSPVQKG